MHQKEVTDLVQKLVTSAEFVSEKMLNGLTVDLFSPKQKKVIEVNGPWHYFAASQTLNHTSTFKYKLLQAMGYTVSIVSYSDWNALRSESEKTTLIQKLLNE